MTDKYPQIPALGVGLGYRRPFWDDLFRHKRGVDFLEITADHYFDVVPEKERELDTLARNFTLIPHGLNLSLGSAEGLDIDYVEKFAALVRQVNPPYWSEHIAFTRAGGIDIGHLSPLPFNRASVEIVSRNIDEARRWIDLPLVLENITYMVNVPGGEMNEGEFLTEVLERSDCGLLLDVTNVYTNAVNQGYDAHAILDELPLERVIQLHFVGGHWDGDVLVDSHGHPTPPEVWELMEEVVARASVKGIILERDENIPTIEELLGELERAREIGKRHGRWA